MTDLQTVPTETTGFEPLRQPLFRDRWIASIVSNVGGWMQDTAGHVADGRAHHLALADCVDADGSQFARAPLGPGWPARQRTSSTGVAC